MSNVARSSFGISELGPDAEEWAGPPASTVSFRGGERGWVRVVLDAVRSYSHHGVELGEDPSDEGAFVMSLPRPDGATDLRLSILDEEGGTITMQVAARAEGFVFDQAMAPVDGALVLVLDGALLF